MEEAIIYCPVCRSQKNKTINTFSSNSSVKHLVLEDHKFFNRLKLIIENLWHSESCKFVECKNCSFKFGYPFVAGSQEFYSLIYSEDSNYTKWRWDFQISLDSISKLENINSKSILEIGAGNGIFSISLAKKLFKNENIYTTEYSSYGQKEIRNSGIYCFDSDFRDIKGQEFYLKFDIICMFQTLEHLDKLDNAFEQFNWLTKPESIIFITVPNDKFRDFLDKNKIFMDIPPVHISRWNFKSINYLAEKHGWQVVDSKYEKMSWFSKYKYFLYLLTKSNGWRRRLYSSFSNKFFIKLLLVLLYILYSLLNIRSLFYLKSNHISVSQWFMLQKTSVVLL